MEDSRAGRRGPDRFELLRRLGTGAFGVVWEARDVERGRRVALKELHHADPEALSRFKHEFRALADLVHPNLVALYELVSDEEGWFLTMELVEGVPFVDFARAVANPVERARRLRDTMRQLAEGLLALHEAGKLHADLKPSNVLVTPDGRVKLLDFGMVTELGRAGGLGDGRVMGTPAYMAPEQAAAGEVTGAADWYAAGVMLYQALTGSLPFAGEPTEVLVTKQWFEPEAPSRSAPGVPSDLDLLCRALLSREPGARPSASDVLGRLGVAAGGRNGPSGEWPGSGGERFVGRREALAALQKAFLSARGRPVSVLVESRAGLGKTALVARFLADVAARFPRTLILSGRCREQESVPYKAVDGLVDALAAHLRGLPADEAEGLIPADADILARLFPVLRQVPCLARDEAPSVPDPLERRRRAFSALRELVGRLSERAPLVLAVDDVHWGDRESALLLSELLRPPGAPGALVLAAFRTEEKRGSHVLADIRASLRACGETVDLSLPELTREESGELARSLLGPGASAELLESVVGEAGGSPLLLHELCRFVLFSGGNAAAGGSLEKLLEARLGALPWDALSLLLVAAVAGAPVPTVVACEAARIETDERAAVGLLRMHHLVLTRERAGREELEVWHEPVRRAVLERVPKERRRDLHRRLADAWAAAGGVDPETLAVHLEAGGDPSRAATYAQRAAEAADQALAFDRAARLYRKAMDLSENDTAARRAPAIHLGNALANAGKGREAAEAYLSALVGAPEPEQVELQRRAAEQLLRSGYVDEGLSVLRSVLRSIGYRLPQEPMTALVALLAQRAVLAVRGLRFTERREDQLSARELLRVDTCWSVAVGLGIVDTIRGSDFQARHLRLALRCGEPYRVARALAMEAGYRASGGDRTARVTRRLLEDARVLADRVGSPHARGLADLVAGIASALQGRFREATRKTEAAEDALRRSCTGVAWEIFNARYFSLLSRYYLGEYATLSRRLPLLLLEAEERGDLYASTTLRTRMSYLAQLAADDPEEARRELQRAMEPWSRQGFHLQHMWEVFASVEIDLYTASGAAAYRRLEAAWPEARRSLLLRVQLIRVNMLDRLGRSALAAAAAEAAGSGRRASLLERARKAAGRLLRDAPWGRALGLLLLSQEARLSGRDEEARDLLLRAEMGFDAAELAAHSAAARRARGLLIGGDEGRQLERSAEAFLAGQEVKSPARLLATLAPAFP